jgi:branched-subunit amino acid ABC-type transport system permease component
VPDLGFNIVIPPSRRLIGGVGSIYAHSSAHSSSVSPSMWASPKFRTADQLDRRRRAVGSVPPAPDYKPAIIYAAVVLVLLLRPSGLIRREMA